MMGRGKPEGRKPLTRGRKKSDGVVVPEKQPNKDRARARSAEDVEGRTRTKGNSGERDTCRIQSRESVKSGLARVREAARRDRKQRFTSLYHHVYNVETLRKAYRGLKRRAVAGIDGVTWREYGKGLEEKLDDLSQRLKRGAYRAKPVRRIYIKKEDGSERAIGVPTTEDKVVQMAVVVVLNQIYEVDFLGFSNGFRPGRDQHKALDALAVSLHEKSVRWVLDADIRGFFDALDHEWLLRFVEHRIGDKRILRLLKKWLKAGVMEGEKHVQTDKGAIQGGCISPLLGNIYLHYVFDLWAHQWRHREARATITLARYADDLVVGFSNRADGQRFEAALRERFAKYGLELHPEKTRLIEFGRFAETNRKKRGQGKAETFEFLGLTHIYGKSREGKPLLLRRTSQKRMHKKLREVKDKLRRNLQWSTPQMGTYLAAVLRGHVAYYGVPTNSRALGVFRFALGYLWKRALERRSERTRVKWTRMRRLIDKWLPPARICHPYPSQRFYATTRGRSPVR